MNESFSRPREAPGPTVTGPLVIGIDAGGTRTRAYLATATTSPPAAAADGGAGGGPVLGAGAGGPGNALSVPRHELTRHLAVALDAAVPSALRGAVTAVVGGFAGAAQGLGPEAGRDLASSCLAAALEETGIAPRATAVCGDIEIAFASAPGTPADGLTLIAGTGAVAARIADRRRLLAVDGDGWLLGDDGSGFWLGSQAMRAVLRALDGRGPWTSLVDAVGAHYLPPGPGPGPGPRRGSGSGRCEPGTVPDRAARQRLRDLLVPRVYAEPPVRLALLSPLVVTAARAGDAVALALLDGAADELAATVAALEPRPGEPLVVTGGLLGPAGPLLGRLTERAAAMGPRVIPVPDGGAGAVALARLLT